MANDEGPLTTDERVQRSVSRTLGNLGLLLILVAALVAWGWLGSFTLKPGEAAVMLLLGRHVETITQDGLHIRLPTHKKTITELRLSKAREKNHNKTAQSRNSHGFELYLKPGPHRRPKFPTEKSYKDLQKFQVYNRL